MAIHDFDGTTDRETGKLYDSDGTTVRQIGVVYDHDGTADRLIYKAELVLLNGTENQAAWTITGGVKDSNGLYLYFHSDHSAGSWIWTCNTTWAPGEFAVVDVRAFYDYGASPSYFDIAFYNANDAHLSSARLWAATAGASSIQDQDFERTVPIPANAARCRFIIYVGQYYSGSGYRLYAAIAK